MTRLSKSLSPERRQVRSLSLSRGELIGLASVGLGTMKLGGMPECQTTVDAADEPALTTEGVGDVKTPRFYRCDIGVAPNRMHEPTAGTDGNIWTSPLDGSLWQYDTITGRTTIHDLKQLTGQDWKGLHLWPIARGSKVYLCTPGLPELHVWDRERRGVVGHKFPHQQPAVHGGFVEPVWHHVYFYDTRHASVLKWNPETESGRTFRAPTSSAARST